MASYVQSLYREAMAEDENGDIKEPSQIDLEEAIAMSEAVTADGEVLQVHPAADIFPMLDDEALAELAEDIKENGLRVPIVVDSNGIVIDGRNRLAACKMAEVEPSFQTYDGDPLSFIISANIQRRHLNAGQRAMATAMVHPDLEKGGPNNASRFREAFDDESKFRTFQNNLSRARAVLKHGGEELARSVMDGRSLDEAYREAITRRDENDKKKKSDTETREKLSDLKSKAPDLAELVIEERMPLPEALAAYDARDAKAKKELEEKKKIARDWAKGLSDAILAADPGEHGDPTQHAKTHFDDMKLCEWDHDRDGFGWTSPVRIRRTAEMYIELARLLEGDLK
jgi:hypothetical protein